MNNDNEVLNYSHNIVNSIPVHNKLQYGCKIKTLSRGFNKKMRQVTSSLKNNQNFNTNFYFEMTQEYHIWKGVEIHNKYLFNLNFYDNFVFYEEFKKNVANSENISKANYLFFDMQKQKIN